MRLVRQPAAGHLARTVRDLDFWPKLQYRVHATEGKVGLLSCDSISLN
jgi:hypothetical protein